MELCRHKVPVSLTTASLDDQYAQQTSLLVDKESQQPQTECGYEMGAMAEDGSWEMQGSYQ
jgi:hypothetical protein